MMDDLAYLPMDIMVMILSRLPVKSLLRFKAVCKSWNALIASPPFMRSHLLNFNTSKSHTLFINAYFRTVTFVRYQDRKFQMDEAVYELPEGFKTILCSCNGVLLLRGSQHEVLLWNPSIRKMDRLYLPFKLDQFVTLGLCYNPVIADLRIVAASWEKYAIFFM